MSKLHELLAVDTDIKGQTDACVKDLKKTFEEKKNHFIKRLVTYRPVAETEKEVQEQQLSIVTTVPNEMAWIGNKIAKLMDIGYQIDIANMTAKADIVLEDGSIIAKDMPATALLRLQHHLETVRDVLRTIHTLDPSKGYGDKHDPTEEPNVYKAQPEKRIRTEKTLKYVTMYPHSDKHPAQVKDWMADERVGEITSQEWSSLITVRQKSELLDRVEEMLQAVKRATARANEQDLDVKAYHIGATLLGYIYGNIAKL